VTTVKPRSKEQTPNEVFAIVMGISVALHAVLAFALIPDALAADRDSAPEHYGQLTLIEASTAPFKIDVTPTPLPKDPTVETQAPAKTAGPAETPAVAKGVAKATPETPIVPAKPKVKPKARPTRKRIAKRTAKPSPIATPASPATAASEPAATPPGETDAPEGTEQVADAAPSAPATNAAPKTADKAGPEGHANGTKDVSGGEDDRTRLRGYLRTVHRSLQKGATLPRTSGRHERGVVLVEFVINDALEIIDVRVKRSSGSSLLDRTAVKHVRKLGHLPSPPAGLRLNRKVLTVPIRFA
jgi:protein TonB